MVLVHALGVNLDLWAPQVQALAARYRVLRLDVRGHGASAVPAREPTMADLGGDVIALLDHLNIARAHVCGLSMGGAVAIWLAAHHPRRVGRLVLCNTAPRFGTAQTWRERIEAVRARGLGPLIPGILERWFTPDFRAAHPEEVARVASMLAAADPAGYAACCAALRDCDLRADLGDITAPTLVLTGSHDPTSPPADSRALAASIAGARYVELDAAHLSNWAQPQAFNATLLDFFGAD